MRPVEIGMDENLILRYPPNKNQMSKIEKETFYNDMEQTFSKIRMELKDVMVPTTSIPNQWLAGVMLEPWQ